MAVIVQEASFDPWKEMSIYQDTHLPAGKFGGSVMFVGTMRDFNDGVDGVSNMYLEHYPGMTERHLERVCQEAMDKWDIIDTFVIHRVGSIGVNDPIVLVGVWSVHRSMAFDANRFIINDLKHRAPFWKRESSATGERWVETNSIDQTADNAA